MQETLDKTQGEQIPGVYVRSSEADAQDLDLLWSGNRGFHLREERSPLLLFGLGFLVGTIITSAVFLFFTKPQIQGGKNLLTLPVIEEANHSDKPAGAVIHTPSENNNVAPAPVSEATQVQTPTTTTPPVAEIGSKTHTVKNGETLGQIAQQYYGSSDPQWVDKIQRANNLKNPDSLQLDQTLTIPPKSY